MKKTYTLQHPKIKVPRIVDSIKHDVRKYLKRERRKPLPSGATYWGFDCKLGVSEDTAAEANVSSLSKAIDALVADETNTIYIEIFAKPVHIDKSHLLPED